MRVNISNCCILYIYIYYMHKSLNLIVCKLASSIYIIQSTFGASLDEIDDLVRGYYISLILHKNLLVFLTLVSSIRIR